MNKNNALFCSIVKNKFLFVAVIAVLLFGFSSCKTHKKIVLNNGKCLLDFKNSKTLTTNLKANEFKFNWLNAKMSVESDIDSSSNSFSISLRIKRDSVIWMSISKLGIEGARVLITKDSVRLINRIKNNFFIGDFAYISKLVNTELDFEMLQSLLVGNSVEFYDEEEKIKPGIDNCQYTLGTIRKYRLRRIEKGKELKEPAQSIYLVPETFKIAHILFYEFNPDRSFDAVFDNFEKKDSTQLFPMKMSYIIKAQKIVKLDLSYTKLTLNEEQSFPFKIPENYERIAIKEKK
jgi:Domain of unknown function (DUF4292)